MPYQCKDNFELFMEYIGKISALIEESPPPPPPVILLLLVILMQLLILNLMSNYRNYVTI